MKAKNTIIMFSIVFGLFSWIIDSVMDTLIFHKDAFLGSLILRLPSDEIYMRLLFIGVLTGFGIVMSRMVAQRDRIQEDLQVAHGELEKRVVERTAELFDSNQLLRQEIIVRNRAEAELRESEKKLHQLSFRLMNAQETERRRISLELHDDLGQSLSVLKLQLKSYEKRLRDDQADLKRDFEETLRYIDQTIDNIRRLSHDLSPCILEDLGLSAALRKLVNDFGKHSCAKISVEMEEVDHLFPRNLQIIIYRIFQEALTNVEKHARAAHISIIFTVRNTHAVIRVEDDGRGFDMKQAEARCRAGASLGLATMNERARMLDGALEISSAPEKGTRISLAFPIQSETAQTNTDEKIETKDATTKKNP
ncbi:sensor histidine kinase [Candidatus Poribacteria bacterium]|nr:sensor histidine kinase [Candidatus Poribacteria bacterium]